jgi:hypothetical protein
MVWPWPDHLLVCAFAFAVEFIVMILMQDYYYGYYFALAGSSGKREGLHQREGTKASRHSSLKALNTMLPKAAARFAMSVAKQGHRAEPKSPMQLSWG